MGKGYVTKTVVNHHTNIVYAASKYNNTISIINGTTNEVVGHIPVHYSERSAIAVNPNTNAVYVTATNGSNRVVSIINGTTNEIIAHQIPVDYSNRTVQ
jgi:YVTN family beta-propeller protein